ncbi:hypothetical protein CJP72_04995 [Citrobacter sp. NCU1]|uniref:phage protein NinX family protein n=1 Tax=Citrobacter sp. NCU1 TaxID=2026683 RepID=UPI00139116D5|nr:phage protein NinX family protein [Citrobacter sp. NCU1]NDO80153.1 hypothetical protein [Citrobacter sp. NCU1]
MDYSTMSDGEISVEVAKASGIKEFGIHDGAALLIKDAVWTKFDPCNNPADAWPIIEEHEINILWNWNDEGVHGATASPLYEYEHPNALRAAMTVFLMKHG